MRCPKCQSKDVRTTNSRDHSLGRRRRRVCNDCGNKWATMEITDEDFMRIQKQPLPSTAEHQKMVANALIDAYQEICNRIEKRNAR